MADAGSLTEGRASNPLGTKQVFVLPYPPSANNLFVNLPGRGRVQSPRYKAWINGAAWTLKSQRPHKIKGKCRLTIDAVRPDNRRRDIANLEKAISDLLVSLRVIEDDSLIESITLAWVARPEGPSSKLTDARHPDVRVTLESLE